MSNGNQSGEKRSDAGGGADKGGGRRRYFRRRKRTQQPAETPSPETRRPQESRKAQETPAKNRTRNSAKGEAANKGDRDRRGRRRRRSRSERGDETPVVRESTVAAIDHEYTLPKAVFVYTYVLRPSHLATHEFRPEHFSRVGRRLEDFQIDLSPLFPEEGKAKAEPKSSQRGAVDEESDEGADAVDEFAEE